MGAESQGAQEGFSWVEEGNCLGHGWMYNQWRLQLMKTLCYFYAGRHIPNTVLATVVMLSLGLFSPTWASAGPEDELLSAARSPYDIERFVEKTPAFDWSPLWRALKIQEEIMLPRCEGRRDAGRDCSSELILIAEPQVALLLLRSSPYHFEVYLRFIRESGGDGQENWRFAGHFEPPVKYFDPTHKIVMFGDRPHLVVTGQGEAGTCLSTEVEYWLDLAAAEFRPVFSYTAKGTFSECGAGELYRSVQSSVGALQTEPVASITVEYGVDFSSALDLGGTDVLPVRLGSRQDTIVYTRKVGEDFKVDEERSTASERQVEVLYEDLGSQPPNEDFLRWDLEALTAIAEGPDTGERQWLEWFLENCPDTAEKRRLARLLETGRESRTQESQPR